jgi:hypothetical protein
MLPGVGLSTELEAGIKEFTADGAIEIRENGGRVAPFAGLSWDVQRAAEKPLLHLRSENHNLTRRVLAITDHSDRKSRYLAGSPSRSASATRCFALRSRSSRGPFPTGGHHLIRSRRHGKFGCALAVAFAR